MGNAMKAIGKYLIIKQIDEQKVTSSGLMIQDDDLGVRYKRAHVINVGTDVTAIQDGDVIQYDRSSGHSMILEGEVYSVILERDVVLVE